MRILKLAAMVLAMVLALAPASPVALATNNDPLFVNLTTDDAHRATMALGFTAKQQARKHPVTIFLNDRAVVLAAKSKAGAFSEHQKMIADILAAGGTVLICPLCMKHYSVGEADLIDGVKIGNPDLVGAELFRDDARTLTW